jgi:hypothetical protein
MHTMHLIKFTPSILTTLPPSYCEREKKKMMKKKRKENERERKVTNSVTQGSRGIQAHTFHPRTSWLSQSSKSDIQTKIPIWAHRCLI